MAKDKKKKKNKKNKNNLDVKYYEKYLKQKRPSRTKDCPDILALIDYIIPRLDYGNNREIDIHVSHCAWCKDVVETLKTNAQEKHCGKVDCPRHNSMFETHPPIFVCFARNCPTRPKVKGLPT